MSISDSLDGSLEGLQARFEWLKQLTDAEDQLAKQGSLRERVEITDEQFERLVGRGTMLNTQIAVETVVD